MIADLPSRGNGPRWQALCARNNQRPGERHTLDLAGTHAVGSTTAGRIDPATGRYVGTARAFAAGLTTTDGTVDLVSSVVHVTVAPGAEPTVSYRSRSVATPWPPAVTCRPGTSPPNSTNRSTVTPARSRCSGRWA